MIHNQATINIGTIGHVAHGKSTLTKALSGVSTIRHKAELERNITIKLGYANAKIFQCEKCPKPQCFQSLRSNAIEHPLCKHCKEPMILRKHISIIDSPGHESFVATMLSGTSCMDAVMMLVAADETCPAPQTSEHLAAIEIMKIQQSIIVQNKIDLVNETKAKENMEQIQNFVRSTVIQEAPIIPICAQKEYNVDYICQYICESIQQPVRNLSSDPLMTVVRSFDVNKPGCIIDHLKGGVLGGTISQGVFKVGDQIEMRPGIVTQENGKLRCRPIISTIKQLQSEETIIQEAYPGGLIGIETNIDPTLTRSDRLVGQLIGHIGKLPDIYLEIVVHVFLLRNLIGAKGTEENKIKKITEGEALLLNIGSMSIPAHVKDVENKSEITLRLHMPVCTSAGSKCSISRRVKKSWRLIGWGHISNGSIYSE